MLKIAVGHSNDPDSLEAIDEVLQQCQQSLSEHIPQAGILFAAIDFEFELILQRINETYPDLELIGGSTDGEVSSILEFQQDSLTLILFCSDEIEIRAEVGRHVSKNPYQIAATAIERGKNKLKELPQLCLAIPESLTTSTTSILEGLKSALGNIPIFGGATADRWNFTKTYQFFKTEVLVDSVPFLLFSGNILFSHGVVGGWRPIGKKSLATKVDKNIIYEIDGAPAVDFYRYYLNGSAPATEHPLAVFPEGETTFFLRGVLSYDLEIGSLKVSGDLPENAIVQITEASLEDILLGCEQSFLNALNSYPGQQPTAALFFSCSSRRKMLGTRVKEEYKNILKCLPTALPSCGFYTYGEIAPFEDKSQSFFHNTTFITLLLGNK
jgi:hypothetical protein